MSERAKHEFRVGIITIIITIGGSLITTVWWTAKMASQIEDNAEDIHRIEKKIDKITSYLFKKAHEGKDIK